MRCITARLTAANTSDCARYSARRQDLHCIRARELPGEGGARLSGAVRDGVCPRARQAVLAYFLILLLYGMLANAQMKEQVVRVRAAFAARIARPTAAQLHAAGGEAAPRPREGAHVWESLVAFVLTPRSQLARLGASPDGTARMKLEQARSQLQRLQQLESNGADRS